MNIVAGAPSRHGAFILLRRLRQPLAALILVYAVAVLGLTLMPGTDPAGQPWRMSFLHAFYFVSFLGTTIGLGEIPYPFSDAQRLWVACAIYATVIAWLYAIGALFAVLQDPSFRRLVREGAMQREMRRLREPFYLLCGYDDAGFRVARELTEAGTRLAVIDSESARVEAVDVDDHPLDLPALAADASDPKAMTLAGLGSPHCRGVLALTGSDQINTKIALTARLLNPHAQVLCAARDHAWHPRMASAGADHIINPFDTFAERVAMSLRTPSLHVIYEALTTQAGTAAAEPPKLPRGRWVLCGWNLFSRTLRRQLERLEIETTVVGLDLDDSCDAANSVRGDATDVAVLREAKVEEADAVVACTDVDIDNLTIVLEAKSMRKTLFVIARQNQRRNGAVFRAAPCNLVMLSGYVVAAEVLRNVRAPLLSTFLRRARDEDEAWAAALLVRLREVVGEDVLESWTMNVTASALPAVCEALARGQSVSLRRLMTRPDGSGRLVRAVPLLLQRRSERRLLPPLEMPLELGDEVLFCGRELARSRLRGFALTRSLAPPNAPDAPAALEEMAA